MSQPPSTYAIDALVRGEPGAIGRVAVLTLTRTVLIAPGLWLAGIRDPLMIAKASIGSSLTLTAGMTLFYFMRRS